MDSMVQELEQTKKSASSTNFSVKKLIAEKLTQQYPLYSEYLNHQLVNVMKTLGFNKRYIRANNQYLYDEEGNQYLDLLSGYGVHILGRNHPTIIHALQEGLNAELANLVQFDCPLLAACLAEKLTSFMPEGISKYFFCNSGTEANEGAIKFARAATGNHKILYCERAFHGLTTGTLALNGSEIFKRYFEPLLPGTESIPFNDLSALEQALKTQKFAAFILEPIQGKGIYIPDNDYLKNVSQLCQKYKTLLILDEVQTGIGRSGKFFAFNHWPEVSPDLITMAKGLSGGFIPVGVIAMKPWIFNKTYRNMEHSVIHSCTFGRNDLAMIAGLAVLDLLEDGSIISEAAIKAERLLEGLQEALLPFEMVKEVRGKGMMIGIEFGPPSSLTLKAGWKLLETANKGLFCQLVIIPLFQKHRMLTQVAGHQSHTIRLLPSLTISDQDVDDIIKAFKEVVADAHRFPGAIWNLGKTLATHSLKG